MRLESHAQVLEEIENMPMYKNRPEMAQRLASFVSRDCRKLGTKRGSIVLDGKVISWNMTGPDKMIQFTIRKTNVFHKLFHALIWNS